VPTFEECIPDPIPTGTGLNKYIVSAASTVHPGGVSNWRLDWPAHTGPLIIYDTFPPNTYIVNYEGGGLTNVELLIGGTWYDIGPSQIHSWMQLNFNAGTLDNLVASGVQTGASAVMLNESSTSLGSYYIDGATAMRVTTPAGANQFKIVFLLQILHLVKHVVW